MSKYFASGKVIQPIHADANDRRYAGDERPDTTYHPVSAAQRELWLFQRLSPERSFTIALYAEISGPLDPATLAQAVAVLVAETPALQTGFSEMDGELYQWQTPTVDKPLTTLDLRGSRAPLTQALDWMREDVAQPRHADDVDLFAFVLFQLDDERFLLFVRYHHILGDGRSGGLLARRVADIYLALVQECAVPPITMFPFGELARRDADYRASPRFHSDRSFWRSYLESAVGPAWLSRNLNRDAEPRKSHHTLMLTVAQTESIKAAALALGVQQPHLLIAAMAVHFRILVGQDRLNFSLPVLGCTRDELNTPGMTANVLPLILSVCMTDRLADVASTVANEVRKVLRRQRYRTADIRRDMGMAPGATFGPSINLMSFDQGQPFARTRVCWHWHMHSANLLDTNFMIAIAESGDRNGLEIILEDDARCHSGEDLQAHVQSFLSILNRFASTPEQTVQAIGTDIDRQNGMLLADSLFARRRQPEAAGCLRWNLPARSLASFFHSLQFPPPHAAPLGRPRLLLDRLANVGSLEVLAQCSGALPGTLLEIGDSSWRIATGSQDVRIGQFTDLGRPFSCRELALAAGLRKGERLPLLSDAQVELLTRAEENAREAEPFWLGRLKHFSSLPFPFGQSERSGVAPDWQATPWHQSDALAALSPEQRCEHLLGVWCLYLARITGETDFQLGWYRDAGEADPLLRSLFVQTLPMQVSIDLEQGFTEICRHVASEVARLKQHHAYPDDLVTRHPDLSAMQELALPHPWRVAVAMVTTEQQRAETETRALESAVCGELLTLQLDLQDGGFRWIHDAARLDAAEVERMTQHMLELAESSLALPMQHTLAAHLNLLPPDERELLLYTWNRTQAPYPQARCIHQLFEEQVERTPQAIALVHDGHSLSYAELNRRANQLAHALIARGVRPEDRVALCVARSPAMVAALLGILKAGGAYVPLDPAYPADRLHQVLADAAPLMLLADAAGRAVLGDALSGLSVLDPNVEPEQPDVNPLVPELTSRHLAYVIYTSGSTGAPKGVMVEHRNAVNLLGWCNHAFAASEIATTLFSTSISFDLSIYECFGALTRGAIVHLVTDVLALDGHQTISLVNTVPSALTSLIDAKGIPPSVHTINLAGEPLKAALIRRIFERTQVQRLCNLYGPSETTTYSTWLDMSRDGPITESIGRPIANTRLYVLDRHGQPVPLGVAGELYIGGAGVARGYLNRPELTAERFLPDPFVSDPGARLYRTGDLVRYLPDGNLEFLGRNDQQLKIRGFRIEPGEIEARLLDHPAVREAVVIARDDGTGAPRLVAYVVTSAGEPPAAALREHLARHLPDYMVPAAFVALPALPLTPNGKLDRRALPAPDGDAYVHQTWQPPQGELETLLASLWAELLHVPRVGRHDSFFELGGHSLLAVRLASRLQQLRGVALPIATLFAHPTPAGLAHALADCTLQALPPVVAVPRGGPLPLSFAQQRLWFLAQLEGVSQSYHIPLAVRLRGSLDEPAWQQALDRLFARHEALRSVFVMVDGLPQVQLLDAHSGLPLARHDLRDAPDAAARLAQLCHSEAYAPFDLARGPLLRACLVRLAQDEYVFLLTQHHIVSDGWSLGVMVRELNALYTAACTGQPDPLPPLAVQYPDYAVWQRQWLAGEQLDGQAGFWRRTLADAPALLTLPTDRPRPARQDFSAGLVPLHIDAELTRALREQARQHGVTLFMLLLAAWAAVLARLSGQEDLVIGTPVAGRRRTELEPLLGFFVNTLALRLDLSGEPDLATLLARVRETALAALDHQDLPFEQVVELLQPVRRLDHSPLFQVMFAWQNSDTGTLALPGLTAEPVTNDVTRVRFDLELSLAEAGDTIVGTLQYADALFDAATIGRHAGYLQAMLRALAASTDGPVSRIGLLPPDERELLLYTWNRTQAPYPQARCIHQLFEEQVERTPQATALVHDGHSLSYAELNRRANQLAHALIARGVRPEDRVALCVARSPAMVAALLGILKAGGAYVPLDPAYPADRLHQVLADAAPLMLLADAAGRAALGDALSGLSVLDPNVEPEQPDVNPLVPELTSRHLAYVIYTSGSTGAPKGVMVEHRNAVNLAQDQIARFGVQPSSRILQFASCSFDASVFEIVMAFGNGAALHLPVDDVRRDRHRLWLYMERHAITHVMLPPALLQDGSDIPPLDTPLTLILGGEAIQPELLRSLSDRGPLFNAYGPTEITVCATVWQCDVPAANVPIGRPIANTRLYVLDRHGQPVPLGVAGELYIGGAGVARGYLNRPELTAERFLPDPFVSDPGARLYRTGDLVRYLPDGNLEFLGRNDQQLKIRGFRIEPGEIEARLLDHPAVREAVVIARDDGTGAPRLVAYVVTSAGEPPAAALREHLARHLPDYMVPAAFVALPALPLTPNGKLDRRALPAPDGDAYVHQTWQPPQGELETLLASLWAELLHVPRVGRHDSFFELGGHSLLAVRLLQRLREHGLGADMRTLFATPTLSALAATLAPDRERPLAPNLITPGCTALTPDMLPLIQLDQQQIDRIVAQVPGGLPNLQDIYPLSPLQEGILFHHLMATDGDPYLLAGQMVFADRALLSRFLDAMQQVIARHDILRTAFLWENLPGAAQVVWRHVPPAVTEFAHDPAAGPLEAQLARHFDPRHYRLDLSCPPLLRFVIAPQPDGRWRMLYLLHHLIGDHATLEGIASEVRDILAGHAHELPAPQPFRNLVAQARLGTDAEEHERFFRSMLAGIDEPTTPFGLLDVHRDGSRVSEARCMLPAALNSRLRAHARRLGVSLASLCHVAWGQVVARTSGREQVVFGTVLLGRLQAGQGADRALGLFINTLPLRLALDHTGIETCVRDTQVRLAELLAHEHASLALAQRCSSIAAPAPLFTALLNYRHNQPASPAAAQALPGVEFVSAEERTNYPLTLSVEDDGQSLGLTAQALAPLAPERLCAYMQHALGQLAELLEQAPQTPVRELEILPPDERELLLYTWNRTQAPYPQARCIHQLFEEQVERTPQATALVHDGHSLSYAELNRRANQLAHALIARGVRPEDRVALCVARSPAMVAALLGILKAGGAYVPLDPAYPADRLHQVLADAAPLMLLADAAGRAVLGDALSGLSVLDPNVEPEQPDVNPLVPELTSRHLAYVIYTSGSTGAPKGVMVEHRNAVNLLGWCNHAFAASEIATTLFSTSISFDLSIYECFGALTRGAIVHLVTDVLALDGHQTISLVNTVPSALTSLIDAKGIPPSVHTINLAGEPLKAALIRRIFERTQVQRLCNLYGPSETTTYSTWLDMSRDGPITESIGRPIANTRLYVLDRHGQPVPLGVAGELYIGGAGVARGYLNRPELTAERFLPDPFVSDPGARLYRTGDLVRYLPDGNLEFLGRNDQQLKIRGFRIEPGEIEARLLDHPAVREAVVIARDDGTGAPRLVAYVVTSAGEPPAAALREHLARHLPDYMVPAAFVALPALPLTPNGKLDRRALPAPDGDAYVHQTWQPPQGELETLLASLWAELLHVPRVGRHDGFFELGGHSLLAVRLLQRLREHGLGADMRTLFATPTLSALAATLAPDRERPLAPNLITPGCTALTPDMLPLIQLDQQQIDRIVAQVPGGLPNLQDIYPLSPLQEGILFHHLMATDGDPYLLAGQMVFADRALLSRFLDAMQQVIARHDILRTAFLWENLPGAAQVVWRHVPPAVTEFAHDPAAGPLEAQLARHFDPRHYRLDLSCPPLLRFVIAPQPDGRWRMLYLLHHLIGDHATLEGIASEVRDILAGHAHELPAPQPFRNLVAQARLGTDAEEHERFFRSMLAGIDEPTTPFGLLDVHRDGSRVSEARCMLPAALNSRLRAHARRLGVSLASLCHVAWGQVVARTSGREQVVFGTVLLGRLQAGQGADRALGLFINTLPLRLALDHTGIETCVRDTQVRLAELLAHEHASLALAQRCSSIAAPAPLFTALLNYRHNQPASPAAAQALPGVEFVSAEERTNYPLTLSVEDDGQSLGLTAQALAPLAPERLCAYMQHALGQLAELLEQAPQTPVRELEILPPDERELLLYTWNRTQAPYPQARCIHQLFEEQVERTPQATALVHDGHSLSYAELNRRANQLAHALIARGVRPEDRVALCVARSPAMVAALLGILKAGGAYVPLDPAYPADRLHQVLADAAPLMLLADTAGRAVLGDAHAVPTLDLDTPLSETPAHNPAPAGLHAACLAYVIYTSGSTGAPKGAQNEHRAVVNRLVWMQQAYALDHRDVVLQKTPVSFDVSVWEFFWTLLNGATLLLASPEGHKDPHYLAALINSQGVTTAHFVPSILPGFLEAEGVERCTSLRRLICSGEALPSASVRRCQQVLPGTQLYNLYGPTEAAIDVTAWSCPAGFDGTNVPIGRPIANTRLYVLDRHGQPVPLGVAGELYIGGAGVARGYLNRPELTAERFLPDPFVSDPGARLYRTGDLVRYLPDGNLEFLGRNDQQLKIRGFRIEPGEIEARLLDHPAVREAVVIARDDGTGAPRLVAYVVTSAGEPPAAALREHLARHLPDYMVPAAFVALPALPLTPNGKLDRRALPAPDGDAYVHQTWQPPQGELETLLASLWAELLHVPRVGRHDSFFELGGHSLLAVRLASQAANHGLEITVSDLYQNPVLSDMAMNIARLNLFQERRAIPVRRNGSLPPLFFVPDGLGDISYVFELAKEIHLDCAIYALPLPSAHEIQPQTLEAMALMMVNLVQQVQPHGPYRIAGYSMGGILAYAIAQNLIGIDETVSFVGLIDTPVPLYLARETASQILISEIDRTHGPETAARASSLSPPELVLEGQRLGLLPAVTNVHEVLLRWQQRDIYANAAQTYTTQPLSVTVHQFYATEQLNSPQERHQPGMFSDKTDLPDHPPTIGNPSASLGWEHVLPPSLIRLEPVPGNHLTMMTVTKNRAYLAKCFTDALL